VAWSELEQHLARHPVLRARDFPELRGSIRTARAAGRLTAVLPGIYARAEVADRLEVRAAAAMACAPDGVIVGTAALALVLPAEVITSVVDVACPTRHVDGAGIRFSRRKCPAAWVVDRPGLRLAHPAMAAIDVAAADGGSAIDLVLRRRLASLEQLRTAMADVPGRIGNRRRAEVILDSRDEPWSQGERLLHRLLRAGGLTGWRSNHPIAVGPGRTYFADVAFPSVRWLVEVDGWAAHGTRDAFAEDRRRQNLLELAGWRCLRFTWADLVDDPERVLDEIRHAVGFRVGAESDARWRTGR
jgi:very-short-patch-repair endonuclease